MSRTTDQVIKKNQEDREKVKKYLDRHLIDCNYPSCECFALRDHYQIYGEE